MDELNQFFSGLICKSILTLILVATGCSAIPNPNDPKPTPTPTSTPAPLPTTNPVPDPHPTTSPTPAPIHKSSVAALWEPSNPKGGASWTQYAFDTIDQLAPDLIAGTADVTDFCPNYAALDTDQKISFWVYFVSGITKYESNFSPTDRYKETGLGIDPITHTQVYSEGLLQLSYQDVLVYPYCNEFDWNKDKLLSATDPNKTIFDPFKNLKCGIQILNQQARTHGRVTFTSGNYWSTLMLSGQNSAVTNIKNLTHQIAFCLK